MLIFGGVSPTISARTSLVVEPPCLNTYYSSQNANFSGKQIGFEKKNAFGTNI